MKNFILLLLFLVGSTVCRGQSVTNGKNDLIGMNLKGSLKEVIDTDRIFEIEKDIVTNKTQIDTDDKQIQIFNFNQYGYFTLIVLSDFGVYDSVFHDYDSLNNLIEKKSGSDITLFRRGTNDNLTEIDEGDSLLDNTLHKLTFHIKDSIKCQCDAFGNVIYKCSHYNIFTFKYDKDNYINEVIDSVIDNGVDVRKGIYPTVYKYDSKHNLIEKDYPNGRTGLVTWELEVGKEVYKCNEHGDVILRKFIDTYKGQLLEYTITKYTYDTIGNWVKSRCDVYRNKKKINVIISNRKIVYY